MLQILMLQILMLQILMLQILMLQILMLQILTAVLRVPFHRLTTIASPPSPHHQGHVDVVRRLVQSGAYLNARTVEGSTALTASTWRGDLQVRLCLSEAILRLRRFVSACGSELIMREWRELTCVFLHKSEPRDSAP
jgi:hypothetical protein